MWLAGCKCHSNICDDVFIIFICCGVLFAQAIPHTLWYYILSIILILLISEKIFIFVIDMFCCSIVPNGRVCTGRILGSVFYKKACSNSEKSFTYCVSPLWCDLCERSHNG